jgi:hypothetical protein
MEGAFSLRDGLITIRENIGLVNRSPGDSFLRLFLDLRLGILQNVRLVDESRILNILLEPTNLYLTGEINRLALQGVIRAREGTLTLFNGAQFTLEECAITFRPDLQSDPGLSPNGQAGYQIDPLVSATAYSRFRNTNPYTTTANEFIDVTVSVRAKLSALREGKGVTFASNAGLSEQELLDSLVYASSAQSLLGGFFRKWLLGDDYQSSLVVGRSVRDKTYVDVEKRLFERLSIIYKGEVFTNFPEYDVGVLYHIRPNSFLELVKDEQDETSALVKYRWRF